MDFARSPDCSPRAAVNEADAEANGGHRLILVWLFGCRKMCVEKLRQITVLYFSPHIFRHFRDPLVVLPDGFELVTNYAAKSAGLPESAGINPKKSGIEHQAFMDT